VVKPLDERELIGKISKAMAQRVQRGSA
jgi:hypothetical protein